MSENRQKLIHLRSSVEKIPQAADLNYGEIAIQYAKSKPVIYIKNTDNEIVKFIDEVAINTLLSNYVATSSLTANYATSADTVSAIEAVEAKLTNVYRYKGTVASYDLLPSQNLTAGDVYNVESAYGNYPPGTNYAWTGTAWDALGGSVDLSNYATTGDVNTLSGQVVSLSAATVNIEASAHTHDNKSVLDGIDATKVGNWDDAAASAHNHTNASVLNGIESTDVDNWDAAAASAHSHANASVLDGIESTDVDNWNAASASAHNHTNADVLNGIDATKVGNWDNAAASAHSHTNASVLDGIQSTDVDNWNAAAASAHNHTNADVLNAITSEKTAQWDSAYTVSQNALVGIETGKESGADVNANNELDFSGLYIDCGTY